MPKPGEFYRHFKNKLYQVLTVARHSETGEKLVIYQALYGDFQVYARPLAMFAGEVDKEKYPDVTQRYRFELISPGMTREEDWEPLPDEGTGGETDEGVPNPWLIHFLDAETSAGRLEALEEAKGRITQETLNCIYEVLDMQEGSGTVEDQVFAVRRYLEMQRHYDGARLR